jgi:hypothetical protein
VWTTAIKVSNGQWGGIADFEMAHAPVGLAAPGKGTVLGAVPQLVLLDKVFTQDVRLTEVRDGIQLGFEKLGPNPDLELYWPCLGISSPSNFLGQWFGGN